MTNHDADQSQSLRTATTTADHYDFPAASDDDREHPATVPADPDPYGSALGTAASAVVAPVRSQDVGPNAIAR